MNITQAALASGLPVKTIRYYEELGLVVPARNIGNGYREYSSENLQHLNFLRLCRDSGLGLDRTTRLLRMISVQEVVDEDVVRLSLETLRLQMGRLEELIDLLMALSEKSDSSQSGDESVKPMLSIPFRLL